MAMVGYSSCCDSYTPNCSVSLLLFLLVLLSTIVSISTILFNRMILFDGRCLCCPCKRRRKRPSLDKFPPEDHSFQRSTTPCTLNDSFTNGQYLNDDTFLDSRPSSVASSRNADDIQLTDLTSRRKIKPLPHYTLAIQRSPRITPILAMTHK